MYKIWKIGLPIGKLTLSNATLFFFIETSLDNVVLQVKLDVRNLGLYLTILSSFCTIAKFPVVFCVGIVYVAQHTVDIH